MRNTLKDAILQYIEACRTSNWIAEEAYKFEFANFLQRNVNWAKQSDDDILAVFLHSQRIKYSGSHTEKGIQFIPKSGRESPSEFISAADVALFRQIYAGRDWQNLDWKGRSMSFTGLSAWLASLFPNKIYPIPLKGYNFTIQYLFETTTDKFPKVGLRHLMECQPYLAQTEQQLRDLIAENDYLSEWNTFYKTHPELGIPRKEKLSKVDWVWLVQDFHLFVHRRILHLYKKTTAPTPVQKEVEISQAIEGHPKLSTHLSYERNTSLITKIKAKALAENPMLNCQVCGFSFRAAYGEIGAGFIEAHHIQPLSERASPSPTKPEDLVLVCSNCHRMLHRGNPTYSIEELKAMMQNTSSQIEKN